MEKIIKRKGMSKKVHGDVKFMSDIKNHAMEDDMNMLEQKKLARIFKQHLKHNFKPS